MRIKMFKLQCLIAVIALLFNYGSNCSKLAKDNGDIYVVNEQHLNDASMSSTTEAVVAEEAINFEEVAHLCNRSFSIPIDYLVEFNNTGALPDVVDKTAMCHIRCFYEKSGMIENWKLSAEKIRHYMWPATGDSLDYCEKQGKSEVNACVRTYMIARCLMLRAIVDARNKPMV